MAKNTYKSNVGNEAKANNGPKGRNEPKLKNEPKEARKPRKPLKLPKISIGFLKDRRVQLFLGFFFLLASFFLTIAFVSYLFTGHADQSVVEALDTTPVKESGAGSENWLGLLGAWVSDYFIYQWFGIAAFFIIPVVFFAGY